MKPAFIVGKGTCSWCQKRVPAAKYVIAGPNGIHICNECIDLCNDILTDQIPDWTWRPSPRSSDTFFLARSVLEESSKVREQLRRGQPSGNSATSVERLTKLLDRLVLSLKPFAENQV